MIVAVTLGLITDENRDDVIAAVKSLGGTVTSLYPNLNAWFDGEDGADGDALVAALNAALAGTSTHAMRIVNDRSVYLVSERPECETGSGFKP